MCIDTVKAHNCLEMITSKQGEFFSFLRCGDEKVILFIYIYNHLKYCVIIEESNLKMSRGWIIRLKQGDFPDGPAG